MIVYEFLYCSDSFESASHTVSIHLTLKGAYVAMRKHRMDEYYRWLRHNKETRREISDGSWQSWRIRKTLVLD